MTLGDGSRAIPFISAWSPFLSVTSTCLVMQVVSMCRRNTQLKPTCIENKSQKRSLG
jgi:hypothetical protein